MNIETSLDRATNVDIADYQIFQRNGPNLNNDIPEYIF